MYIEGKQIPFLVLGTYAALSSAAPFSNGTSTNTTTPLNSTHLNKGSKHPVQFTGWCGEDNKLCGGSQTKSGPQCSANDDPTGECSCPSKGILECPVSDPNWQPPQIPGGPTKRDLETRSQGDKETPALVRRIPHQVVRTREPLHDAIRVLGFNILQQSVQSLIIMKLDQTLKGKVVTGVAGHLSQRVDYNGVRLDPGAPFTIRWDYDPTNLIHVNLDAGKPDPTARKPSELSILFKAIGSKQNMNYYNDVLSKLSQVAEWGPILSQMAKGLSEEEAIKALGTTVEKILQQVVTFWSNLYNAAGQGHDLASDMGGGN